MLILIGLFAWGAFWLWVGWDMNVVRLAKTRRERDRATHTAIALRAEVDRVYAERDDPIDRNTSGPRARRNRHGGVTVIRPTKTGATL